MKYKSHGDDGSIGRNRRREVRVHRCNRAVHLRKQQLSPGIRTSKATASTVIAIGNLRQGRLMADHGGLYSTTKLRQLEAKGVAKAGCARVAFPIVKGEREGGLW
jgi:hypothetical protein